MSENTVYLPADGEWLCRCGRALVPARVDVTYLQGGFGITLLACPGCGRPLVPVILAEGRMAEVERLLEDK